MKDMAAFGFKCKATCHARSISLPCRSHPLTQRVEEQLYNLRSSEATSTSASSIDHNLTGLKNLHDCVNDLLQMPLTQQVLANERADNCVSDVLDGSIKMLDICSTARDVLLQTKECAQDLQSALRRRRGGELGIENEVALVAVIGMLREVESMSLSMLESLLSFVSWSRPRSKSSGWSLVSKLMNTKHAACQADDADNCEIEKVDYVLSNLIGQKSCKGTEVSRVMDGQKQLESLQLIIKDLEGKLECAYKSLLKTRVSLLNIFSC